MKQILTNISRLQIPQTAFLFLLTSLWFEACGHSNEQQGPPPPKVTVSKPFSHEVMEQDEYPGRLQSPETVSLSARVSGVIEAAPFQEGATVKKDEVLFRIDERPFRAEYVSRQADVARAEAQLGQALAHYKRYEKLQGTKAISAEDFDEALAAMEQAKAGVAVAKAALAISKLNLDWTQVTSPIEGKISRKYITVGNLVIGSTGQATPLTTVMSVDPLYSYVNVPERTMQKYKKLSGDLSVGSKNGQLPCQIQLEGEQGFAREGVIDFIDNKVDPGTGTVQVRCSVPNPDAKLTTGAFVRMRLPGSAKYTALLVPDLSIGTDQNTRYVLVVQPDDTVVSKTVKIGALFGKLRAVNEGLEPDARVIVAGLQLARPGTKVSPTESVISPEDMNPISALATPTPSPAPTASPEAKK